MLLLLLLHDISPLFAMSPCHKVNSLKEMIRSKPADYVTERKDAEKTVEKDEKNRREKPLCVSGVSKR